MKILKVIRLYYGFQLFFSLLLWAPVFYEFQSKMGLSDEEIFSIQSLYYVFFCFFELPTGFVADRWGHRLSMLAGGAVLTVANLLPLFRVDYGGFLLHWMLVALARSLVSGAASAYIYDYLKAHGCSELYKEAEGKARALSLVGRVVGWSAVGYLMEWQITSPYWMTAVASLLAVFMAYCLPSDIGSGDVEYKKRLSWDGLKAVLTSGKALYLLIAQGSGIFVLARIVQVNLFQPLLLAAGFTLSSHGLIMGVTTLFEALGAAKPNWMRWVGNDAKAVFVLTVVLAWSTYALGGSGMVTTLCFLSLFALAVGMAHPIQRKLVNDAVPDPSLRATMLSVESLLDRLICSVVVAPIGYYMAAGELALYLREAALGSFVLVGGVTFVFLRWVKKTQ